jgi:hypothetical protein
MSIEFFDNNPSLNDIMRDERNDRLNSWSHEPPKDRWKIDKKEPFELNLLVDQFNNGEVDRFRFASEIDSSHGPHIDLDVTRHGFNEQKYRILDPIASQEIFDQKGPNWTKIGF